MNGEMNEANAEAPLYCDEGGTIVVAALGVCHIFIIIIISHTCIHTLVNHIPPTHSPGAAHFSNGLCVGWVGGCVCWFCRRTNAGRVMDRSELQPDDDQQQERG